MCLGEETHVKVWCGRLAGKVLIAGLDPCQRLSGIALKLLAFERLLTDYECYRDRVVSRPPASTLIQPATWKRNC